MTYKRILTIQDISCVGQCSMTVALPILSVCGHETCILPTAMLSTHTGGFGRPAVIHMDRTLDSFWKHWKDNDITFDAILVGYLGSVSAIEMVETILKEMLSEEGVSIVDPAMADHGKLYSGFDVAYAEAMQRLCRKADIIIPNVTEAAIFANMPYQQDLSHSYVKELLETVNHPCIILTGVGYQEGQTGIAVREGEHYSHYAHPRIGKNYHGTGDMFAAAFTGSLMQGKTKMESVEIAAKFVCKAIENTEQSPAHWYGVKFETALADLIQMM